MKAAHPKGWRTPTDLFGVPCSFVQVEVQCEDLNLMQCGLEKCVAAVDGSVEWVMSAHSKVRLVFLSLSNPFSPAESQSFALCQDRFMHEGAKSLIWNQHSLGLTSGFPDESLEA